MKLSILAAASAIALVAGSAGAATIVVPGTSDPFLAGAPSGAYITFDTSDVDSATAESPVAVGVTAGQTLKLSDVSDPTLGPVGNCNTCFYSQLTSSNPFTPTNFVPLVLAYSTPLPFNTLVGLFNGPSPSVFEIGAGKTFTVPTGATELYLGTVDSYQWNNNVGADDVTLSVVPEPAAWAMMLLGVGMIGCGLQMARRKDAVALPAV